MNVIKTRLRVGAAAPFRVLHVSDTHLTRADMRDGERKVRLSRERSPIFPQAEETLALASQVASGEGLPILHTGDLIDFVSVANLEAVKRFTDENDYFMAAGNHEFSLCVGEAKEDAATLETVEYIHREAQIKAILAGHLHFNYEGVVGARIPQIITSCTDLRIVAFH